jgi:DNA polymerase-3 subunit alpha/error-prone DNA polymerase
MNIRLGLCSAYSFLYGVHLPGKLAAAVRSAGAEVLCIADRDSLYGVHTILEAAKEQGLRLVIGAVLTMPEECWEDRTGTICCFVRDRAGFGRLSELLTMRNTAKKSYNPLALLRENAGGLVLASTSGVILEQLAGRVPRLYGAVTPYYLGAISPSNKLNLPLAFLDDSLFLEKTDYRIHRVLRAIGLNKTIGNLQNGDTVKPDTGFLLSNTEIERRLRSWPEAFRGTAEIAAECTFNELFDGFVFPGYETEDMAREELRRRVIEGAAVRYGELGEGEIERIDYELGIINKKGFAPYFLVMDDIVKMSPRTCGRGSGAASIISYSLGITNVDPIKYHLYFERFSNPSRIDPPDIDVDFAWDERKDLITRVIARFGAENCARVANHNFFRAQSALRETAKAYGFGDVEITRLELGDMGPGTALKDDPLWGEIFDIARKIEGLPRGLGTHCGGLVITPDPIKYHVPIEKSAEGFPLLAWEKEGAEAAGFVNIDLLGNRSLAVIRDTLANLEEQGIFIDRDTWQPAQDTAVVEALARGDSMGVFYIESPAMRQLQKKTGAGDFEHIVIHSSIIRPAANKFITEYVRRLKGGNWEPLHPRLAYILDETYGILCYQEDVSKTAVAMAGFNEADADSLRKVIAKKAGGTKLPGYEKQFFEGCRKNGVDEETIKQIWAMMLSFDGYSFCKPHSASYAMVSFQSAYLRVYYPAEFMAGVLSNQGGYYRPGAYISECRRMRLEVEGPDINISRWQYYGSGRRVIVGLMAVKGLSRSGVESILKERERRGNFTSLSDFISRVRLGRDDIEALCPAGVFDTIAEGLSRTLQARALLGAGLKNSGKKQQDLFTGEPKAIYRAGTYKTAMMVREEGKTVNVEDKLWGEYNALGFLRTLHPLALWKKEVLALKRIKAIHIGKYVGCFIRLVGWPITQKEVWTKDGLTMSFLSLEDETSLYETVIFSKVYDKYFTLLFDQQPLLVYGVVCSEEGAITLEVRKIEVISWKTVGRETSALRYDTVMN